MQGDHRAKKASKAESTDRQLVNLAGAGGRTRRKWATFDEMKYGIGFDLDEAGRLRRVLAIRRIIMEFKSKDPRTMAYEFWEEFFTTDLATHLMLFRASG